MALYNEIQVGRFNRMLTKLMSMKGGAPAPQLGSEILPSIDVLRLPVDLWFLAGINRFANVQSLPAPGAGNRNGVRLRNPVGSNVHVAIEKITIAKTAAGTSDQIFFTFNAPGIVLGDLPSANGTGVLIDTRANLSSSASVISNQASAAATTGTNYFQAVVAPGTTYDAVQDEDQEIGLQPGDAWTCYSNNLNEALIVDLIWRERFLEDSERK